MTGSTPKRSGDPLSPRGWRSVKVFVSSTFADMFAERDYLVKVVFPELRERLSPHRIRLLDIDLRWGATSEMVENLAVVDFCLRQVEECPFFVGLLGERLGWIPPNLRPDTLSRYAWLRRFPGASLMELEILHGVLNEPWRANHALLCIRDPAFLDDVPETHRSEAYVETDRVRIERLSRLKHRIRNSGARVLDGYKVRWRSSSGVDRLEQGSIVGLEEFGRQVIDLLWTSMKIELDLPDGAPKEVSSDERENDLHFRFAESLTHSYVGREELHRQIREYISGTDPRVMVLAGPPGCGKSSILSRVALELHSTHGSAVGIPHFVGVSAESSDSVATLNRLRKEILKTLDLPADPHPSDKFRSGGKVRSGALRDMFPTARLKRETACPDLLRGIPPNQQVVIVIDGIDRFESVGGLDLAWLPARLPPNVRIVVSASTPAEAAIDWDKFQCRELAEVSVPPLSLTERHSLVRVVPSLSAKTLSPEQVDLLLANPETGNPLFLLGALEELRCFGRYDRLSERILDLPGGRTTAEHADQELFLQIVEQLERDFGADLVRRMLGCLTVSREGLSEEELVSILSEDRATTNLFAVWRQMSAHLQARGTVPVLFKLRPSFHRVVANHYGTAGPFGRSCRWLLIHHFEKAKLGWLPSAAERAFEAVLFDPALKRDDPRIVEIGMNEVERRLGLRTLQELPWQLSQLGETSALLAKLSDPAFAVRQWIYYPDEIIRYWQTFLAGQDEALGLIPQRVLQHAESLGEEAFHIAEFLKAMNRNADAAAIYDAIALWWMTKGDRSNAVMSWVKQAASLYAAKLFGPAMEVLDRIEPLAEGIGADRTGSILFFRGLIRHEQGLDPKEAFRAAAESMNSAGERGAAGICLSMLGGVLRDRGQKEKAAEIFANMAECSRSCGSFQYLAEGLREQAKLHMEGRDYEAAMALLEEEVAVVERLGDYRQLIEHCDMRIKVLEKLNQTERIPALARRSVALARTWGVDAVTINMLSTLARCIREYGNPEGALPVHDEQEAICRRNADTDALARCLLNRAKTLDTLGRRRESLVVLNECEQLVKALSDKQLLTAYRLLQFDVASRRASEPYYPH